MTAVNNEPIYETTLGDAKVTILGTAHVSKASAEQVKTMIESGQYKAVAVELCPSRYNAILNPDSLAKMDLFKVFKEGKTSMVVASLALQAFQQKIAEDLDIEPGAEMKAAIQFAKDNHLPILLIDREIGTTLKRIYRNTKFTKRMELFARLVEGVISKEKIDAEEIERLKEGDILESVFSQYAEREKDLYAPLIDERDQYMSAQLIKEIDKNQHEDILAIVGAGHLKGIKNYLTEIKEPEAVIERLDVIPPASIWPKLIPWIVVAVIIVGFIIGFSKNSDLGWALVLDWVLINGGLAAFGAMLAAAHPLTIISAFIAAPITSLNPTIGAGMVTGFVELLIRKPKVEDFSSLRKDTSHLKGWWTNRVARTLLVFLFSTLGSVIGTYVAGYRIFDRIITS